MKYIIAIDSLKECLSSHDANQAVAKGLSSLSPTAEVSAIDVSDGGEGFLDAMRPVQRFRCHAHDAMMRGMEAEWGATGDTAIVEVARVVGLQLVEPEMRNPLRATSYGVGELLADAMRHGFHKFIVGLGGTATSDCGLGMLQALKEEELRRHGKPSYAPFDTQWLSNLQVTLATDVMAPLLGPQGAAHVFAPQKGATPEAVDLLERKARTLATMAAKHQGRDCSGEPGAGAAGGLGYAFMEFMHATVRRGADLVLDAAHFDHLLDGAQRVITGEGHADQQTLMGKLPATVLARAQAKGVPVTLVAGRVDHEEELRQSGFDDILNINDGFPDDENALRPHVAQFRLREAAKRILKV